mgnify:CR=1 FL=1
MYDIIGNIAIINPAYKHDKGLIQKIKSKHKNVHSIYVIKTKTSGIYRIKRHCYLWGKKSTKTIHKENKLLFELDINKVFFSPRMSFERMRIAKQIKKPSNVIVMFAGIGPFPITLAKYSKAKKIYGIEINKTAYKYFKKNIELNRVKNVEPILGDVRKILKNKKYVEWADRILMPHPYKRTSYLKIALKCIKNGGVIHYYDFANKDEWENEIRKRIEKQLPKNIRIKILNKKVVREIAKNILNCVFDIKIYKKNKNQ